MISAVVLTCNDEKIIKRCLDCLAWCDEVIVIDDESKDNTPAIVKKMGAKLFSRKLNENFSAQRNFGLSKAKNNWVLFVDSDEIVSDALAKEIEKIDTDVDGYYIRRSDFMWDKKLNYGETANVKLLRLAKKNSGKWERPVHETWNIAGNVGELVHPLLHYPHSNVAQFIAEINRYSTLNANYFYTKGVHTNILQIVAFPAAKFFLNYVWRLGFLDGTAGAIVAVFMSFHSFLTRAKLYLHTPKK